MATLQAHGPLKVFDYLKYRVAVCADRHILRDRGDGWKLSSKLKFPYTPEGHVKTREAGLHQLMTTSPAYVSFREKLFEVCGRSLPKRVALHCALDGLSNDPDGLHSQLQDEHPEIELELEDTEELCTRFDAMRAERQAKVSARLSSTPAQTEDSEALDLYKHAI